MSDTSALTQVRIPGFGTLRLRGNIWWIRYSYAGKRREESAGTTDQKKAERLLKQRIMECGKGRRIDPTRESRVKMAELFDSLERDYSINHRKSIATLPSRLAPLREAFGSMKAVDVTAHRIAKYIEERLAEDYSNASVNRELAALKRSFHLAVEQERISSAPPIKLLKEAAPRQGFVKAGDFELILRHLPEHLKDFCRFAYITGTRRGEISKLTWADVDRDVGKVVFRREHSKNGQPRTIRLVGDLYDIIERRWVARALGQRIIPFVFHRKGEQVQTFRKAWTRACTRAGFPMLLVHDLRRSAVRNLVDAGVDQTVAMRISGHQTASVFARYRIVSDDDIAAALERTQQAAKLSAVSNLTVLRPAGTKLGHSRVAGADGRR
jgi:integrase